MSASLKQVWYARFYQNFPGIQRNGGCAAWVPFQRQVIPISGDEWMERHPYPGHDQALPGFPCEKGTPCYTDRYRLPAKSGKREKS